MRQIIVSCLLLCIILNASAQHQGKQTESERTKTLDSIIVTSYQKSARIKYLPDVSGVNIFAGKKTNSIKLDEATANLQQNSARMAFAKVPGLTMWDMDGAGTQLNIGSRGTDSHRSIEMNVRQNGYNTNSDVFGYPEDHYTPPMQGVKEIQLVRGSAALQFGSQFGGMMNLVMKEADSTRPFALESEQTAGSNNFFNSFNAVNGTKGKFSYYAYFDSRHGDGWRPNSAFNYHAYYINLQYHFTTRSSLSLQFSRMDYVQQIAGGLDDAQFNQDSKQSIRNRNFFNPEINIPALTWKYEASARTRFEVTAHSLIGQRNSVQFINNPNIPDTFNVAINSYNPRQVDRDYYSGFTTEARVLHSWYLGNFNSVLTGGVRFSTEQTKRRQKGVGTIGSDFDLSLVKPYGIDLRFKTYNYAAYAENMIQLTDRFSVTPGMRYEIINTDLTGVINNATFPVNYKGNRSFPLFGVGLQYQPTSETQIYGNISQAYRPYLYASVTPADRVDQVDPNLKDSKGYDIDLGYRGKAGDFLSFDVNGFYLFYGNRVGLITQTGTSGSYLYSTNVGDAVSKGIEAFFELSIPALVKGGPVNNFDVRLFNSLSYTHARYTNATINKSGVNTSIKGNKVENTPEWIDKTGLTFLYKTFLTTFQHSYTGENFNDALNTVSSANGVTGLIPSYNLWDWSVEWKFLKGYRLSGGINNFMDKRYFSRRITMYPGPGILPADGRTFYVSVGVKL
ncbi:MAG: TonB-dependent receptor [Chitinophagaceae bacterium]